MLIKQIRKVPILAIFEDKVEILFIHGCRFEVDDILRLQLKQNVLLAKDVPSLAEPLNLLFADQLDRNNLASHRVFAEHDFSVGALPNDLAQLKV